MRYRPRIRTAGHWLAVLLMIHLAALATALLPPPQVRTATPASQAPTTATAAPVTELGTLLHFPGVNQLDDAPLWAKYDAEMAQAAATLRAIQPTGRIWLRWDFLWHERWYPFRVEGRQKTRTDRIVAMCKRHGFSPLANFIPHPWPTSAWYESYYPAEAWGHRITPLMHNSIAVASAGMVADYRAALKANGIKEADAAIQVGNEPASGHPGGNDLNPKGTWAEAQLWKAVYEGLTAGTLNVISGAISMDDGPADVRERERATARQGAELWQYKVTGWAYHNRVWRGHLTDLGEYTRQYLDETNARAERQLALWDGLTTTIARTASRKRLWVTEGYVAEGDFGGDRAEAWASVMEAAAKGKMPKVRVFIAYRWWPEDGQNAIFPLKAREKAALKALGEKMKAERAATANPG